MQKTKKNYFLQLFTKGYFLSGLFIALVASALLIFADKLNLLLTILKNAQNFLGEILSVVFLTLVALVYIVVKLFRKKYSAVESVYVSVLLTGFIYFLYVICSKNLSIIQICFSILLILFGLVFLVVASFYRDSNENTIKIYTTKSFITYYKAITQKFSFLAIFLGAVIIYSAFMIFANRTTSISNLIGNKIFLALCAIPFAVYIIVSLGSKKLSAIDGILLSSAIALPTIVIQTICSNVSTRKITLTEPLCIAFIGAVLIFTLVRHLCINLKYQAEKDLEYIKNDTGCYFKKLIKKYNIFSMVAVAGIVTMFALNLFRIDDYRLYLGSGKTLGDAVKFFPYILINISLYSTMAAFAMIAIVNCASKDIGFGDYALGVCIATCIFVGISLIFTFNAIVLAMVLAGLILFLAIFVARIRHASKIIKKTKQSNN